MRIDLAYSSGDCSARWKPVRSLSALSNRAYPSGMLLALTNSSMMRLIQDSTIDLVTPILSCNDQPSIKIAE